VIRPGGYLLCITGNFLKDEMAIGAGISLFKKGKQIPICFPMSFVKGEIYPICDAI
jgi:hypothetical protein